ncbi:MAG: hypothetical protein K6C08_10325 [Oscillospiraceae bacterium]|nr:hypothetical protein [Oscillospiraceae bacterium]
MAIKAKQTGEQIDADLTAINEAQTEDNNDLIIYIRRGALAFDTYDNLFTVVELTSE